MVDASAKASLTQSIATYSALRPSPNIEEGQVAANANTALLQKIAGLMAAAAAAFAARRYQVAISEYQAAESLIYAHLDPQWDPELGPTLHVDLPRTANLFDPLLSASSQWLNILTVPTPTSPVRPLVEPAVQLPLQMTGLHGAGLTPSSTNPTATAESIADIRLATIYDSEGNTAAGAAAVARADALDATLASELKTASGLATTVDSPREPVTGAAVPARARAILGHLTTDVTSEAASALHDSPISILANVPADLLDQRQVGIVTGSHPNYSVTSLQWPASGAPDIETIKAYLYTPHASATSLPDAVMTGGSLWQHALNLPYYYFYVIPLGLAQCYQALGDYENAIKYYELAAQYAYINVAIEGPYIWVHLAECYLAWGDSYYKRGETAEALAQYSNVLQLGGSATPDSPLYTLASLATAADIAKQLTPELPTLAKDGVAKLSADDTLIAAILLKVYGHLLQLNGSLDFWGLYEPSVPIWTFDYLQRVAINFTQLAQQAEQQVINFWTQAQAAELTEAQLNGQLAQATGQVVSATAALTSAEAQAKAYQSALTLAKTRASDAEADATAYQSLNSEALEEQALASSTQAGESYEDGLAWPYTTPREMLLGSTSNAQAETIAETWQAGTYSQEYQVASMERTTTEMQQAATQAQDELNAAEAQVQAAAVNIVVATLQVITAQQVLEVFDADTFTAAVWAGMGDFMMSIYQVYMNWAITVAKLMEKAYNFENDTTLTYIQNSYQGVVLGLLGADALMLDIQAYSYALATTTRGKLQPIQTSISLATNYGYLFDTQLRSTGTMSFETGLDDFDSQFPGTYQGRIKSVSVELQGIIPPSGVSGSLTNGGISRYRLPADIASGSNTEKMRIQDAETLILSDYAPAQNGPVDAGGEGQAGIFEGAGLASTWTLSLPPSLDDIEYDALTDVVLTFVYEARFDPQLVSPVLADLASRPGFYSRQRAIPLAWLYPDLFFAFQSSGTLTLALAAGDFPANQTAPVVTAVGVLLGGPTASALNGVTISLSPPGKTAASAATGSSGAVGSQANAAWADLTGGSALGAWVIKIEAAANPGLVSDGALDLSAFSNMTLLINYTFTPRA